MLKKSLFASLLCFTSLSFADKAAPQDCGNGPQPYRLGVRHIEGNGIGYNRGYTTFEGFFASDVNRWCVMPFLDARAHVFDDGKWAANAGFGARGIWGDRIYGINAYYDYRNTKRQHYNQVAMGLETLGKWWDIRVNGYLPVGKKGSPFYNADFSHFSGHSMIVRRKQQFAMKGADAEIGAHLNSSIVVPFYAAIGPYYFEGKGHNAYGGKFRLNAQYRDYIWVEGSISYDNIFKDIYQGQVAFTLPLGKKTKIKPRKNINCSDLNHLEHLMVQRVVRTEIIPVDSRHKHFTAKQENGDPLTFIFTSTTGHSDGSFNNPFSSFNDAAKAAQSGNVVYDKTGGTYTLTGPMTFQNDVTIVSGAQNQVFETNFGNIFVRAIANQPTTLIGAAGSTIFNVGNNTIISGFNVVANGGTIIGSTGTVNNLRVSDNNFRLTNSAVGIKPKNVEGDIDISGNTFTQDGTAGDMINLTASGTTANIRISENIIQGPGASGTAIVFQGQNSSVTNLAILDNMISGVSQGLNLSTHTGSTATAIIDNNTLNGGGISITADSGTTFNTTTMNNKIHNASLALDLSNSGTAAYYVANNDLSNSGQLVSLSATRGITRATFLNNTASAITSPPLAATFDLNTSAAMFTAIYIGNSFPDNSTVTFNNTVGGTAIIEDSPSLQYNTPKVILNGKWVLK